VKKTPLRSLPHGRGSVTHSKDDASFRAARKQAFDGIFSHLVTLRTLFPATGLPPDGLTFALPPICSLTSESAPEAAPVDFAGLAPGMVGIYQVDVMVPRDFPTSFATFRCFDREAAGTLSGDSGTISIVKK
jgi:hypothetical protein